MILIHPHFVVLIISLIHFLKYYIDPINYLSAAINLITFIRLDTFTIRLKLLMAKVILLLLYLFGLLII